jgi:ankyrin repeat protein
VNWNDHTRKLQEINVENFDFNSLVAFLYSASLPDSKYTDFNMSLLKQALQNSGNITVLMDGFDEITPIHTEKAAVILSELMKTKVGKVWVTSRPVHRERLEKVLSVTAFTMKKLSHEFQVHMFLTIHMFRKTPEGQEWLPCINQLLKLINQSVNDSNFTGSPLFIKMIASAYDLEKYRWIRPGFFRVPQEIDLACLYEKLVERKLHIYLIEKGFGITNDSFVDNHKCLKKTLFEDFEKSALVATLPCPMLESLHKKKIQRDIQTFLGNVLAGNEKTGIVMNVVEGKPQFVHRSFAEYFAARWFSKNFESNRRVMEHILFDTSYRVIRDIFDRMMTKDCPLHCAVLNWDSESVETLLGEGCDVNAVDKGGRTVTHLIATRGSKFLDIISLVFQYKVSLDNNDNILQWTPLQYAIKSENWFFMEKLLESNVDISGLDMIRHRVHDPGYIDPIIMHAAWFGHLLCLEYLCSIGVNIHGASSKEFPSLLHAAINSEKLHVVKWLIQHGADCNTRYSDGQTPLFYAVTEGSLDDVRALVEEGGASLEVCDDQGRTAIDWANDYASNPENRDIIVWKGDVERLKKIVNYLNLCGCKESSSV